MRIKVPNVGSCGAMAITVLDLDTLSPIGYFESRRRPSAPTQYISLFGGSYVGRFGTHSECVAFAKGVESVLNHLGSSDGLPAANRRCDSTPGPAAGGIEPQGATPPNCATGSRRSGVTP